LTGGRRSGGGALGARTVAGGRGLRGAAAAGLAVACGVGVPLAWGSGVPTGAIATVGNVTISKVAFEHWLVVAQRAAAASAAAGSATTPPLDPPSFTACVAFRQRYDPKPAQGRPKPAPARLVARCRLDYESARDQAVPFLITAEWIRGESAEQGVAVTDAEIASMLKSIEARRFATAAELRRFLASSGETQADLLFRVGIDALSNKLRAKVAGGAAPVTPADVAAYYSANPSQFSEPERRDLRIVLVRTAAQARHVRALLASGQSIGRLAREYSVDAATRARGGAVFGVVRGQHGKALDAAIFSAGLGRVVGPVKTARGYEIVRVQKITAASTETLGHAPPLIRRLVTAQRQQAALTAFDEQFQAKWRARTTCAPGYTVAECSNASITGLATLPAASTPPGTTTVAAKPLSIPPKPVIPAQHGQPPTHLVRHDLAIGHGRAARDGDTVTVRYVVKLWTGQLVDDSWARPFTFTLGTHAVIKGFDQGLRGIRPGGRRLLTIPPGLAYGSYGRAKIPSGATLAFSVYAVSVTP
jgi:foldase protein PrsA